MIAKDTSSLVFRRTEKGEDLLPIVKLLDRLSRARKPSIRFGLSAKIIDLDIKFFTKWKQSGIELVKKAFA